MDLAERFNEASEALAGARVSTGTRPAIDGGTTQGPTERNKQHRTPRAVGDSPDAFWRQA